MIKGSLDYVDMFSVSGWALNTDSPDQRLKVKVFFGNEKIGETIADIYRNDIECSGLSDGWSGYIFNFSSRREFASLETVQVFAPDSTGTPIPLDKPSPSVIESRRQAQQSAIISAEQLRDAYPQEIRPIFVLGAARSGTSAMAKALNFCFDNKAMPEEGHFLHLLPLLKATVAAFYEAESEELPRNTLIHRIPAAVTLASIAQTIKTLVESALPTPVWVDKTPTPEMLDLVPDLLRLWPRARFVFMRRRALDNIASRKRKFPHFEFITDCREWAYIMNRWAKLREMLGEAFVEVDQYELMNCPETTSDRLSRFLGLSETDTRKLISAIKSFRPQRTVETWGTLESIEKLEWAEEEKNHFIEICGPEMERYGYSYDESYFSR